MIRAWREQTGVRQCSRWREHWASTCVYVGLCCGCKRKCVNWRWSGRRGGRQRRPGGQRQHISDACPTRSQVVVRDLQTCYSRVWSTWSPSVSHKSRYAWRAWGTSRNETRHQWEGDGAMTPLAVVQGWGGRGGREWGRPGRGPRRRSRCGGAGLCASGVASRRKPVGRCHWLLASMIAAYVTRAWDRA